MCKFIIPMIFLALFTTAAMAGDYPKVEVFGGYQYSRLEGGINANGFNLAVNANFNDYFGIAGDFGTGYWSQNYLGYSYSTYTFGPVLSLRENRAYTPFVHLLIGGEHESAATADGVALLAGGGVDFKLAPHMAFRAAQADWFLAQAHGATSSKNARISTGLVFRF
jgi:hypothetical protein